MTWHVLLILGAPVGDCFRRPRSRRDRRALPHRHPTRCSGVPCVSPPSRPRGRPVPRDAVIRRSASGSGPLTLSPARRRGCRAWSSSRQLGLTRYETAFVYCKLRAGGAADENRIGGRPKEHVEAQGHGRGGCAARGRASTTKRWWPPLSRFATGSRARHKTSGRMAAMPVECDWPSPLTAAPIWWLRAAKRPVMPGSLIVTDDLERLCQLTQAGL